MPADHEAQSQVKQKTPAKVKALGEGLTRKTVRIAKFKIVETPACMTERDKSKHQRESDKRGSCSGVRNAQHMKQRFQSEKSDDRETRGSMTTQWCWTNQRITP